MRLGLRVLGRRLIPASGGLQWATGSLAGPFDVNAETKHQKLLNTVQVWVKVQVFCEFCKIVRIFFLPQLFQQILDYCHHV